MEIVGKKKGGSKAGVAFGSGKDVLYKRERIEQSNP